MVAGPAWNYGSAAGGGEESAQDRDAVEDCRGKMCEQDPPGPAD